VNQTYTFTVFTPTYNRAKTLRRVYESLVTQTFRDFEWLIVDDGSSDNTKEIVDAWRSQSDFTIRYFFQENSGKHIATNLAASEAEGVLFLTLDSDDACSPNALERLSLHWDAIVKEQRDKEFTGVTCLVQDPEGNISGTRFPYEPTDSTSIEIRLKHAVTGEKWGFHRTEVMREFPFPSFLGEKFLIEGIVWNRISQQYKTRYVNEVLRTRYTTPESLSVTDMRFGSAAGTRLYHQEYIRFHWQAPLRLLLKHYVNYVRFSLHSGTGVFAQVNEIRSRLLWTAAFPLGYFFYKRDRRIFKVLPCSEASSPSGTYDGLETEP